MSFDFSEDQPTQKTPPYTQIAAYYDQIMIHVNYPRWAQYVDAIFRKQNFSFDQPLLDVGCGTGKFLLEMQKLGYHGDGLDPSAEMLNIARAALPDSRFLHGGFPDLPDIPNGKYNLITCLYDSMNYLADEAAFRETLQTVYEKLASPGIFVFDLVSEFHCKYYFKDYIDSEVLDEDAAYTRESKYDSENKIQQTWVRIYTPDGVFEEAHEQRIFDFYEIRRMIQKESDFKLLNIYDEFSFDKAGKRTGRGHFVLKKG